MGSLDPGSPSSLIVIPVATKRRISRNFPSVNITSRKRQTTNLFNEASHAIVMRGSTINYSQTNAVNH